MQAIELRDIYAARHAIRGYARRTPLLYSAEVSAHTGGEVYLKLENLQETGDFKVRGAANRLLQMSSDERARGVLTELLVEEMAAAGTASQSVPAAIIRA